jgi:hypothetical protein
MYLYQKRLLSLEQEFMKVSEHVANLSKSISDLKADDDNEKTKIKFQISLAAERIRLIKEQTAFFMKMVENYDYLRILEDFQDEIINYDADLEEHILICLCEKWQLIMGGDDSEERLSGTDTASGS